MSDSQKMIDFARSNNFSFFPVFPGTKKPVIKWDEFQNCHPSEEKYSSWSQQWPNMNVGIVTGKISDLIVVDLDTYKWEIDRSQFELPKTFSVRSGWGGVHYYYSYPDGETVKNSVGIFPHVDIRWEGWYVVGPYSIHESWKIYEIIDDNGGKFAPCPAWVYEIQKEKSLNQLSTEIVHTEGTRNNSMTQIIGRELHNCEKEDLPKIWENFKLQNRIYNSPPLPESELKVIFDSIASREMKAQKEKEDTQIHKCMEILESNGRFILDQVWDSCYVLKSEKSQKILPVESTSFRDYMQGMFHRQYKNALSGNMLSCIVSLSRCRADEAQEYQQVEIRILKYENAILYDLNDSDNNCISIDESGWRILKENPGYFRRTKNTKEQILPNIHWDLSLLWKYVNISDLNMRVLIMSAIVAMFIPDIQHPLLMVHWAKGSAKSTFLSVLKKLIDPSSKSLLNLPWESNQLIHTFLNDYLLVYDNISRISPDTSDDLCRAVSGGSLSKRKLHTDSDDIIYTFRKCVCVNGINLEATQPDLLQRSIVVELDPIGTDKRISEETFWKNFNADLPYILWGIFDILSKSILIEKTIHEGDIPLQRLADFSKWWEAISRALGHDSGLFGALFEKNLNTHDEVVLNSNMVASILREYMEWRHHWEGTATELRNVLYDIAYSRGESRYFPTTPQGLTNQLNRLKDNLANVWIIFDTHHSGNRTITITNTSDSAKKTPEPFKLV